MRGGSSLRKRAGRRGGGSWWRWRHPLPSPFPAAAMVLESLARIVKVQLPAYLKRLPLPESVGGFIRLTGLLFGIGLCLTQVKFEDLTSSILYSPFLAPKTASSHAAE